MKKTNFFKSLRFRILIILIILGIVPSIIVTGMVIANYADKAVAAKMENLQRECGILCNLIITENYLNDSSSQAVNAKLELLCNTYGARVILVNRDFRVVKDTYNADTGKSLISPIVIRCFQGETENTYVREGDRVEMAVPVRSPQVQQLQGVMLVAVSFDEVGGIVDELEQSGILIIGIIVALSILLAYILSTVLVKPFARVTKSIEDLTDGYQNEEISVPDYTETELITDAFNKMLARMKILDESRQEFVSNVSHELKDAINLHESPCGFPGGTGRGSGEIVPGVYAGYYGGDRQRK